LWGKKQGDALFGSEERSGKRKAVEKKGGGIAKGGEKLLFFNYWEKRQDKPAKLFWSGIVITVEITGED